MQYNKRKIDGEKRSKTELRVIPGGRCALFIKGTKIISNWKECLTQQLLDGDIREYLMEKEQCNEGTFDNICWKYKKWH
jgi:hypothetical protein